MQEPYERAILVISIEIVCRGSTPVSCVQPLEKTPGSPVGELHKVHVERRIAVVGIDESGGSGGMMNQAK